MRIRTVSKVTADAEEATRLFGEAERLERKRPIDFSAATLNPLEAERLREKGKQLLARPSDLTGTAETELVPTPAADERLTDVRMEFLETLHEPNTINVASSEQRTDLATRAGVLPAALDAAVSAQAQGPIEKMLAHQVAAGHAAGMRLLGTAAQSLSMPVADVARLVNGAARMFEACQSAALTLQKLKLGGTQRVLVQYQQQVNVESGGQAVVASQMKRASRIGGRRRK